MSNVFNINNILPTSSYTNMNDLLTHNESYLSLALKYVLEGKADIVHETQVLYKSLLESGDNYKSINESFTTFFDSIITIIERFIKFIKSLFDKFITNLSALMKSDNHIIKNKDQFLNFDTIHEFDMTLFDYTIIPNVPVPYAATDFKEDFFEIIDENAIQAAYNFLNDKIKNNFYDKFRATVLGMDGTNINSSDYNNAMFRVYRNGATDKYKTSVTSSIINNSLYNFINFKSLEKEIRNTRDTILKEYDDIKKFITSYVNITNTDKLVSVKITDIDGSTYTSTLSSKGTKYLNLFIKIKTNQIKQMCDIHALAFGAKLDAIKERYTQDRSILYKGLNELQKYPIKESSIKLAKVDIENECQELYEDFLEYVKDKEGIKVLKYKFDMITHRQYRKILDIPIGEYKDGRSAWRTVKALNTENFNIKLEPKKEDDVWILRIILSDPDGYIYENIDDIIKKEDL